MPLKPKIRHETPYQSFKAPNKASVFHSALLQTSTQTPNQAPNTLNQEDGKRIENAHKGIWFGANPMFQSYKGKRAGVDVMSKLYLIITRF